MKISVVTISYNQKRFLQECIDSVAQQTGPVEYIVVDAGSTDGSRELIERNTRKIDRCIFEPDQGPADGLNKGFKHASGEIFYYLNSDDIVLPGCFDAARQILTDNPELDVLSGGGYIIDENGSFGRRLWSESVSKVGLAHGGSILIQPSTFIRRSAYEKVAGFRTENKSNWDGELIVDLFSAGATFKQVDQVWSSYRVHRNSITGTASLDQRIRDYHAQTYRRLIGSEPGISYKLVSYLYRFRRLIARPQLLFERLRYGKVYGSSR